MNKQLRKNYERIMTKQRRKHNTSESDQLTLEQVRINFIVEQISSKPFFNSRVAKAIWAMKEAAVVTSAIKAEVDWLRHEAMRCLKGETKEWSKPISHLVNRQPDHTAYSDACLKYGMGGHCHTLECWWQISWEELHPDIRK
jgi:hypothetical protein